MNISKNEQERLRKKFNQEAKDKWRKLPNEYTRMIHWLSENYKDMAAPMFYNVIQQFWDQELKLETPDYDESIIDVEVNTRKLQQIVYIYDNYYAEFKQYILNKK